MCTALMKTQQCVVNKCESPASNWVTCSHDKRNEWNSCSNRLEKAENKIDIAEQITREKEELDVRWEQEADVTSSKRAASKHNPCRKLEMSVWVWWWVSQRIQLYLLSVGSIQQLCNTPPHPREWDSLTLNLFMHHHFHLIPVGVGCCT